MNDKVKNKKQLISELAELRRQVAEMKTASKLANERLIKSEERWQSLTNHSPDYITILDTEYIITHINHTLPTLTKEQVIGKSVLDFLSPSYHQMALDCFERVRLTGQPERFETKYRTLGADTQSFDIRIYPLTDKNGVIKGLISTSSNITKRKRVELEVERQLHVQSRLRKASAAISSDLNIETVLIRIAEEMGQVINATSAYINSYEPTTGMSTILAEYIGPEANKAEQESYLGNVYPEDGDFEFLEKMRSGQHEMVFVDTPDLSGYEQEEFSKCAIQTMLYIPLRFRGQLIGYFELWETRHRRQFTPEEITICQDLAQQAAIALENARLYQQAREEIIERKRAETEVEHNKLLLQTIIDESNLVICVKNAKDFSHVWMSRKFEEATGLNARDALGKTNRELFGEESGAIYDERDREVLRVKRLEEEETIDNEHFYWKQKFPITLPDGNIYICDISTEITQRKKYEESLRQLNQAIEQSPVSVMITNLEGTIQYVNPKFCQASGYEPEDVIGQDPSLLNSDNHSPQFYLDMWHTIKSGQEWRGDFQNKKKNGELHWESASIAGVKDKDGEITHYVSVMEDITQRKQREEEHVRQERLAAVGQLAAGIAHDFNNVLAVIILYTELLQRAPNMSAKDLKKLGTMHQQAMHATELTRQILDFSRRSIHEPRPLDFKRLLTDTLNFVKRTIPESIQVKFESSPHHCTVNVDPTQLQQLITNLIVNARDAMPQGGLLDVSLSRVSLASSELPPVIDMKDSDWVQLMITDNGTGISEDVLPHIFEPFFTTKEVGQGTGLGLAQVYGIARQHEGYVTADSQAGEGTTFTVYLPMLMEKTVVQPQSAPKPIPQGRGETLLLVEDNPVLLNATRTVLTSLNYRVLTAKNGEEALKMYEAHQSQIQVILTDVVMPKMDGFELAKAFQQQSQPPKILLMSGFPLDKDLTPEIKSLVLGWLKKPLNIDQLGTILHKAFSN